MNTPCIVIATFTPAAGHGEAVRQVLRDSIPLVHQEDGCELYALHEDVDGRLVLIEKWASREAWQVHVAQPSVPALHASLAGLLAHDVGVAEMYATPCGTPEQGTLSGC